MTKPSPRSTKARRSFVARRAEWRAPRAPRSHPIKRFCSPDFKGRQTSGAERSAGREATQPKCCSDRLVWLFSNEDGGNKRSTSWTERCRTHADTPLINTQTRAKEAGCCQTFRWDRKLVRVTTCRIWSARAASCSAGMSSSTSSSTSMRHHTTLRSFVLD